jgi:undecaprenyl-diphosphatase
LFSLDLSVLRVLYAGGWPSSWVMPVVVLSFLGSGWMLLGLLPALAMRQLRSFAVVALMTLGLTSGAVTSLKALTSRVRPCNALGWAHTLPIEVPIDGSLPSGHAAGSFAFALFVFYFNRRAGWALVILASLVALSRVMLGVHYPSDVVAGAVLGSAFGWTGARLYQPRAPAFAGSLGVHAQMDEPPSGVEPKQMPNPGGTERLPP